MDKYHEKALLVQEMEQLLIKLKELAKENPVEARMIARERLYKMGLIDKEGNLLPPFNDKDVAEDDYTKGVSK